MTNAEHLIENALYAMRKARDENLDTHVAFQNEMSCKHNAMMLETVRMTQDELWQIAQYIMFDYEVSLKSDIVSNMEEKYGYRLDDVL